MHLCNGFIDCCDGSDEEDSKDNPSYLAGSLAARSLKKKFFKQFYLILVVCMPLILKGTPDIFAVVEVILRNNLLSTESNSICWENLLHLRCGLFTTHADIKELVRFKHIIIFIWWCQLSHHYWSQHQWILYCFCPMRFLLVPKPKWAQPHLGNFALSAK